MPLYHCEESNLPLKINGLVCLDEDKASWLQETCLGIFCVDA